MRKILLGLVILGLLVSLYWATPSLPVYQAVYPRLEPDDLAPTEQDITIMAAKIPTKRILAAFREAPDGLSDLMQIPREQRDYLLSLQDDNGIIAQTPDGKLSIPYFSNMAALAMLSFEEGHQPVWRYLDWYLSNINLPDRFGLPGTMYDYRKVGEEWLPTGDYDSADSYAATFLSLSWEYAKTTRDAEFIQANLNQLVTIAEVLIRLQDKDGLIWAKPRYHVKFLMDNAENYRGLVDAALMMNSVGRADLAKRYEQAAQRVKLGVEERLYLKDRQSYAWALYGRWWQRKPRDRWYPDTIAQVYPIVFGLVPAESERAGKLYAYLNERYPSWHTGDFDDRFPWTILALVAATMQDNERAMAYMHNVDQGLFQANRGGYPWHAFEAGFFLRAWQMLRPQMPSLGEEIDPVAETGEAGILVIEEAPIGAGGAGP